MVICGNSQDHFCSALIVPERESIKEWSETHSLSHLEFKELCRNHNLKELILNDLSRIGRISGLYGYEIPRKIALIDQDFSVENGYLTPTLKLKRHLIIRDFKGILN